MKINYSPLDVGASREVLVELLEVGESHVWIVELVEKVLWWWLL